MVNYNNTKIYKIESDNGDKIYIGSTTKERLSQRMANHRINYKQCEKNEHNKCRSFILFDEYGIDNCRIVLIESYPCKTKDEALSREAYYIKSLACVNKNIPGRTREQYKIDNPDYDKNYYICNKEKVLESCKIYRDENKEKICEKNKKLYSCICGSISRCRAKARHEKSVKHLKFISSLT